MNKYRVAYGRIDDPKYYTVKASHYMIEGGCLQFYKLEKDNHAIFSIRTTAYSAKAWVGVELIKSI